MPSASSSSPATFVKEAPAEHPEAALIEAAGLRWLTEAARSVDGAPAVEVCEARPGRLVLEAVAQTHPTEEAAYTFGARLARTHRSLAHDAGLRFGGLPPEHPADSAPLFGPADQPIPMGVQTAPSWGAFHAGQRLAPILDILREREGAAAVQVVDQARERIGAGELDDDEPPALLHGDLWAGNVLWRTAEAGDVEAVLIDPAAHLGHRETDIGFLHLFGLPHLDAVLAGYESAVPLREGWRDRIPLHQLFCLAAHWALFGSAYRAATLAAAERVLSL